VLADYQTVRLSLKGYPTQFLRQGFAAEGIASCADVANLRDGAAVRCAGVVLVRQRPGEGNAVFITLSDETGVCNVLVWARIFENFRKEVMGARLLLAEGRLQKSAEGVLHLMVEKLVDRSADLQRLQEDELPLPTPTHRHPRNVRILPPSRDFH
jgi:error-prone DNA polymerase